MPPMGELANEFSWSRSRDNTFQESRRRYFYHYYGAWGGWDAGANEDVRRLYILKQLASRQQWARRTVPEDIATVLHTFDRGRARTVNLLIDARRDAGPRDVPARLLRSRRCRGARGAAREGRPVRGESARAGSDTAHLERRAARGHQGAAASLGPFDEGVPRRSRRQRRDDRRLREGRGPEDLPMVQLPGGVPPGAHVMRSLCLQKNRRTS